MNIVILGGTGTLGQALMKQYRVLNKRYLENGCTGDEYRVFALSRDELKQKELAKDFPEVKFYLGDIKDKNSLRALPEKIDTIHHVAALKHIDILESNPLEALQTNVLGTINAAQFAIERKVRNFCFSSTDKAVFPLNVYGNCKALSEKYLLHLNTLQSKTFFKVFRWGNVLGSRGSVLHLFRKSLEQEQKIYITDREMTRFWIHIEDAAHFMLDQNSCENKVRIPEMKASTVLRLADSLAKNLKIQKYEIQDIGLRPGEKIHEDLDIDLNSARAPQYSDEELDAMIGRALA